MLENWCHVYAVTTEAGLKEICHSSKFTGKIDIRNIKCFGVTEYPHEGLFYLETYGLKITDEAYPLLSILKKYRYYECVIIPALEDAQIKIFTSAERRYLTIKREVYVCDDDGNDLESLNLTALDDLGILQTQAPVPSMFKFTQVGDNNTQIEKAEVVEIHRK